jgi:7-carboxy-7-deazaguanine synthase
MNINEIFGPTIQGEGKYTGKPSIFIRLNGCNLCCSFLGSTCDTPYTSISPEKSKVMTNGEIIKTIKDLMEGADPEQTHIVFTGGEPLCQQDALIDLIADMRAQGMYNPITIETNGTIAPDSALLVDGIFWSVSPKLSTSCHFEGTSIPKARQEAHKAKRINIDALATIVYGNDEGYQLKFVYSGEESLNEIYIIKEQLKDAIIDKYGLYKSEWCVSYLDQHIMLMPEGATIQQLEAKSEETVAACIKTGWAFCDRLHIRIWNDKRGV